MTRANPAATPIATSKSAALSRVLDMVPKGYLFYTAGRCPIRKARQLALKLHDKYGIGCSPAQRITRKQKDLANAILVMYWPHFPVEGQEEAQESGLGPESATVEWLLLATEGDGAVHHEEALRPLREDGTRLHWLGYELVRLPKRGGISWTWRRPKVAMTEWYALLGQQLARRQLGKVAETLQLIAHQPGFSGVRQQSWDLIQFARSRGYAGEIPFLFHMEKVTHGYRLQLS